MTIKRNVLEFHRSVLFKIRQGLITANTWKEKQDLNLLMKM